MMQINLIPTASHNYFNTNNVTRRNIFTFRYTNKEHFCRMQSLTLVTVIILVPVTVLEINLEYIVAFQWKASILLLAGDNTEDCTRP